MYTYIYIHIENFIHILKYLCTFLYMAVSLNTVLGTLDWRHVDRHSKHTQKHKPKHRSETYPRNIPLRDNSLLEVIDWVLILDSCFESFFGFKPRCPSLVMFLA